MTYTVGVVGMPTRGIPTGTSTECRTWLLAATLRRLGQGRAAAVLADLFDFELVSVLLAALAAFLPVCRVFAIVFTSSCLLACRHEE